MESKDNDTANELELQSSKSEDDLEDHRQSDCLEMISLVMRYYLSLMLMSNVLLHKASILY